MYEAHHGRVVGYVARRTRPLGDLDVAQDVAAEVFALAWRRLAEPERDGVPDLPWLLVTAGNVLRQQVRNDRRRAEREERTMTDRSIHSGRLGDPQSEGVHALSELVTRALDRMRPEDRELLLLRVWDELPFGEIGRVLGCSPGTARVRWLRARRRFADALTHEEDEPDPGGPGRVPVPLTPSATGDAR